MKTEGNPDSRFFCPYPPKASPHTGQLCPHTWNWLREMGVTSCDAESRRVQSWGLATYVARIYADGDQEALCLANDWLTWATIIDDAVESHTGSLTTVFDPITAVLTGKSSRYTPATRTLRAITDAAADLWQRTLPLMPNGLRHLMVNDMITWFETCIADAQRRRQGSWPRPSRYIEDRVHDCGVLMFMDLGEALYRCPLPEAAADLALVHAMRNVAAAQIALLNDVYSWQREESRGDVHNMVTALKHDHGLSSEQAEMETIRIVNDRMNFFLVLEDDFRRILLPGPDSGDRQTFLRWNTLLRHWIRGNYDWHQYRETERLDERGKKDEDTPSFS